MKKKMVLLLISAFISVFIISCSHQGGTITVVSREDGSGTRVAFAEQMGLLQNGKDMTTLKAEITNSTSVVMATVAGNPYAIGYISLGSLNDTVKALKIEGVLPSTETVLSGEYKVSRRFIMAVREDVSDEALDFIRFVLSHDGQKIVSETYIPIAAQASYFPSGVSGKIAISGSTSVSPVMDELAAAYKEINPDVTIEIQQSGSGAGIQSTLAGVSDIGLSSRELKASELESGLTPIVFALDGIVLIVNRQNSTDNLSIRQVRDIYTGKLTDWTTLYSLQEE